MFHVKTLVIVSSICLFANASVASEKEILQLANTVNGLVDNDDPKVKAGRKLEYYVDQFAADYKKQTGKTLTAAQRKAVEDKMQLMISNNSSNYTKFKLVPSASRISVELPVGFDKMSESEKASAINVAKAKLQEKFKKDSSDKIMLDPSFNLVPGNRTIETEGEPQEYSLPSLQSAFETCSTELLPDGKEQYKKIVEGLSKMHQEGVKLNAISLACASDRYGMASEFAGRPICPEAGIKTNLELSEKRCAKFKEMISESFKDYKNKDGTPFVSDSSFAAVDFYGGNGDGTSGPDSVGSKFIDLSGSACGADDLKDYEKTAPYKDRKEYDQHRYAKIKVSGSKTTKSTAKVPNLVLSYASIQWDVYSAKITSRSFTHTRRVCDQNVTNSGVARGVKQGLNYNLDDKERQVFEDQNLKSIQDYNSDLFKAPVAPNTNVGDAQ